MTDPKAEHGMEWAVSELMLVWGRQFDALQAVLKEGSTELLTSFSQIHELATQLEGLAPDDADSRQRLLSQLNPVSERAMHGLQFADRLGQMLDVLHGDVNRLRQDVGTLRNADPQVVERWLDALAAHYTTAEQRQQHLPRNHSAAPEPGSAGVDFF
jgi:hypothetical protein